VSSSGSSQLPVVIGPWLAALGWAMSRTIDQEVVAQAEGLQAVVAAALATPASPLAVSIPDARIQAPLANGVQFPLLWGLHRITEPLIGPGGRGWSFSTFELPLGEADPSTMPAIVFRPQGGISAGSLTRWRREARVRPFDAGALDAGIWYAELADLAGLLVAEYRDRGGDGFQEFIRECSSGARSAQGRVRKVENALRARPGRRGGISAPSPTPLAAASAGQPASVSASAPAPTAHQQATAGNDAYVAGRDQYNITYHWPGLPGEAAALGVLSASEGAKLLIRLSSDDETLDRARNVLTGVAPEVAAPALRMLLRRDEDRVIALLASINEARAAALVTTLGPDEVVASPPGDNLGRTIQQFEGGAIFTPRNTIPCLSGAMYSTTWPSGRPRITCQVGPLRANALASRPGQQSRWTPGMRTTTSSSLSAASSRSGTA
jgi:hypothetical protein